MDDSHVEVFPPSFVEADPLPAPVPGKDYTVYTPEHPEGEVRHRKPRSRSVLRGWDTNRRMKRWLDTYRWCGDSMRACERERVSPHTISSWKKVPWFRQEVDSIVAMYLEEQNGRVTNLVVTSLDMAEHVMKRAKENDRVLNVGWDIAKTVLKSKGILRDRVEPEEDRGGTTVQIIGGVTYLAPGQRALPTVEAIEGEVI